MPGPQAAQTEVLPQPMAEQHVKRGQGTADVGRGEASDVSTAQHLSASAESSPVSRSFGISRANTSAQPSVGDGARRSIVGAGIGGASVGAGAGTSTMVGPGGVAATTGSGLGHAWRSALPQPTSVPIVVRRSAARSALR